MSGNLDIGLALAAAAILVVVAARVDARWFEPRRRARRQVQAAVAAQQETLLCTHIYAGGRCPRQCGRPTEPVR